MTAVILHTDPTDPTDVVADCDCACSLEVDGIRVTIAPGGFARIAALVNAAADALIAAGSMVCEAGPAARESK